MYSVTSIGASFVNHRNRNLFESSILYYIILYYIILYYIILYYIILYYIILYLEYKYILKF